MEANYGYSDGSGDFFITIDTDRCDGCGDCINACPEQVYETAPDDYDKTVARVRDEMASRISYACPGFAGCAASHEVNCHSVCQPGAIGHSW